MWLTTLALAIVAGCGSSGPPVERLEPDALFERGMEEYRAGHYTEAIRAFERLVLEYPVHPRIQEARFHLAASYFGRKEFLTAAGEFSRLASDYPTGAYADDARFKVCEAYYRLSPIVQRDQEYTRAAIEHCESLIAYYPSSEFADEARRIVAEMQDKLAEKTFIGGEFYFGRGAYDSAIIYFEDVVERYPRSSAAPRALLRLVEAYRAVGYVEEAEEARERLLREYPDTAEAKRVQEISLAGGP